MTFKSRKKNNIIKLNLIKDVFARLRPIVSCINTFAYDLSAHLADILSPFTGKSDYTVTNTSHFVSTISHERIQENEVMISFDVESLFTNVPIEGAVKATSCKLENDPGLADRTNLTPTQIADLLTLFSLGGGTHCARADFNEL